jgi:hypothetical protein
LLLRHGIIKATALEDVLPPEREEELEVRPIYGARDLDAGVGRGDTADDGGDGRPVGGQGRELVAASVLDLLYAPRGGSRGADCHDEVDAAPKVVDVGAAELRVGGEGRQGGSPMVTKGAQVSIPGDRVGEGLAGGARGGSGAAGAGESESPLGRVEVCAIREREQGLVAEGGGDGAVEQVRHVSPLAGIL